MYRKGSQFFHILSCAKLKSAGPVLFTLLWRLCFSWGNTDWAPCPFPFLSFCALAGYYDCQSFSNIKAHLKRLNANLISYMKQSWFTFPELFFLSLQTTAQRTPCAPTVAGIMPFNTQSKEWGSALWTVATILQHLTSPASPHTHINIPGYPCSFSSSRYLPTAGAAASSKITLILKDEYIRNFIYTLLT